MRISEQLRRIVKAAPNLPIQMVAAIGLLIGTGIVGYKAFDGLFTNWTEGTAELVDYTEVQERTRESEPEYFYKLHYKFTVDNQDYQVKRERGYRTSDLALQTLDEEVKIDLSPVWYSSWEPEKGNIGRRRHEMVFFPICPNSCNACLNLSEMDLSEILRTRNRKIAEPNRLYA